MGTRFLPLHPTDTAYWALLTCPQHTAGDLEIKREGNFLEVRCRECAREARARGEWVE
jgi:hypothetical protein